MRDEQTEVLVVGAGPVGLLTAIVAAEAGLAVKVIDQESRTLSLIHISEPTRPY